MMRRFMERFFGEQGQGGQQFGMPMPQERSEPEIAMGSGFIIDTTGRIVTNYHVVEDASEVTVTLHGGKELKGKVVGKDKDTDLALIKIDDADSADLQPVTLADSDKVRVGDPVIAIGSPFGLGGTVTAGIVSADHRVIGAGRYDDFLQIDAPINRGNSGGPTFNLAGQVIGVNSLIHSPSGGNVGIGFAIPSNLVKQIVADLEDDGVVQRGWLGVHIQGIDEDLAQGLGLKDTKGAVVAEVSDDSPAAKAGFERGDVILKYDGKPVDHVTDLTRMVADTKSGKSANVVVWRDNAEKSLSGRDRPDAEPGPGGRQGGAAGRSGQHAEARRHARQADAGGAPAAEPAGQRRGRGRDRRPAGQPGGREGPAAGRRDRRGRPQAGHRSRRWSPTRCARPPSAARRRSCCWSSARARTASWRSGWPAPERLERPGSETEGPAACRRPSRSCRSDVTASRSIASGGPNLARSTAAGRRCDNGRRCETERGGSCAVRAAASRVREGARFCARCGDRLALSCPACGAPAPPTHKFCAACGAPLPATTGISPAPAAVCRQHRALPPASGAR